MEDQQTKVAEDFDGVRASDRIRELLAWMDVDPTIPTHFTDLCQSCNALGWIDGPHALTSMRNALAHPKSREKLSKPSIAARVELHQLSLWYVELALLRLIGFDGSYSNRLTARNVGEVELVPWSAAAGDSAEAESPGEEEES